MRVSRILIIVLLGVNFIVSAQKPQRVGYIDMNYILENVPEYNNAQSQLDSKVKKWQQKLDELSAEIEQMKTDLSNEKSLLTNELIRETFNNLNHSYLHVKIDIDTGERIWRLLRFLRDNGNSFEMNYEYTYYEYSIEEN